MSSGRYSRQMILAELGAQGQEALSRGSVLIVGMGGLGCPAALYLAAAGVGRIGLLDDDRVDETNLQRQILYKTDDRGRLKVEAARERLRELNPETRLQIHPERLSATHAEDIFSSYDIILDGTDNFATKFLINDAAIKLGKPVVYGSISQWEGQVSVFGSRGGPCYRCLHPAPPKAQVLSCAEAGVLGAVAGVIGSVQAAEAIKLLLPTAARLEGLSGRLWVLDCATMESSRFEIRRRPECPVCSGAPEEIRLDPAPEAEVCESRTELSASELERGGPDRYLVIDVRERDEWDHGHLPGAQWIPLSAIQAGRIPERPKGDRAIALYCHSGIRSRYALQLLSERGWTRLLNVTGGILAWNGPISRDPAG